MDVQIHADFMNKVDRSLAEIKHNSDYNSHHDSSSEQQAKEPKVKRKSSSKPKALKQEMLERVARNVTGNPYDLEFKLAPILHEWMILLQKSPDQRDELLPIKASDRGILKLMRLKECLEHSQSESASKQAIDAFERFISTMVPELELSLETGVTDLQLSDKQLEYFKRLELNSIKKRLDNLEFV